MRLKTNFVNRLLLLVLSLMIVASNSIVVFADRIELSKTAKDQIYVVKETESTLNNLNGNTIKYVKSQLQSQKVTMFTIIKGKYQPINLIEFLQHFKKYEYTVISQEKSTYVQEDIDGTHRLYINENGTSMEPIVLLLNNNDKIMIRWSEEFIRDNGFTLSEGYQLFQEGYKGVKYIPRDLKEVIYIDYLNENLVTVAEDKITTLNVNGNTKTYSTAQGQLVTKVDKDKDIDKVNNPSSKIEGETYNGVVEDDIFDKSLHIKGTIDLDKISQSNKVDGKNTTKVDDEKMVNSDTKTVSQINGEYDKLPDRGFGGIIESINSFFKKLGDRGDVTSQPPTSNVITNEDLGDANKDNNSGKDNKASTNQPIEDKTRDTYLGLRQTSTKEEIESLSVLEMSNLYRHAMTYKWANSSLINELYNKKMEKLTPSEMEQIANQSKADSVDQSKDKPNSNSIENIWGVEQGTTKPGASDCYGRGLNEIELQACLQGREDSALNNNEWFQTDGRIDTKSPGDEGSTDIKDIGAILDGMIGSMEDEELNKLVDSGYTVDDISKGGVTGYNPPPKDNYKLELGKSVSDEVLTKDVKFEEEMLLLTAYQELSYNVYNEKMEAINPRAIKVVEPSAKKITFINYNNQEVKSKLLLKYTIFFAILVLITMIITHSSRSIQVDRRKEKMRDMMKFREEEIIFTDYMNDHILEVD